MAPALSQSSRQTSRYLRPHPSLQGDQGQNGRLSPPGRCGALSLRAVTGEPSPGAEAALRRQCICARARAGGSSRGWPACRCLRAELNRPSWMHWDAATGGPSVRHSPFSPRHSRGEDGRRGPGGAGGREVRIQSPALRSCSARPGSLCPLSSDGLSPERAWRAQSLEEVSGRELGTPGGEGPLGGPGTPGSSGGSVPPLGRGLPTRPDAGPVPSAFPLWPAPLPVPGAGPCVRRVPAPQSQGRAQGEWDSVCAGWGPTLKGRSDLSARPGPSTEEPFPQGETGAGATAPQCSSDRGWGPGCGASGDRASTPFASQPRKEGAEPERRSPPQATAQPATRAEHGAQRAAALGGPLSRVRDQGQKIGRKPGEAWPGLWAPEFRDPEPHPKILAGSCEAQLLLSRVTETRGRGPGQEPASPCQLPPPIATHHPSRLIINNSGPWV